MKFANLIEANIVFREKIGYVLELNQSILERKFPTSRDDIQGELEKVHDLIAELGVVMFQLASFRTALVEYKRANCGAVMFQVNSTQELINETGEHYSTVKTVYNGLQERSRTLRLLYGG